MKELEKAFTIASNENRLRMMIEIESKVAELFEMLQALKNGNLKLVSEEEEEEKFEDIGLNDLISQGLNLEKLMKYSKYRQKFELTEPEKVNLFNLNTVLNLISEEKNINAREKLVVNGSRPEIFALLQQITVYPSPIVHVSNLDDFICAENLIQQIHSLWSFKTKTMMLSNNT